MKLIQDQEHCKLLINDYNRNNDMDRKFYNEVFLSKIEPHTNNQFVNKDTVFPIITNMTHFIKSNNSPTDENSISGSRTGWIYSERLSIKANEIIHFNDIDYKVVVPTIKKFTQETMVLESVTNGGLFTVDLRKSDNIESLYNILQKRKIDLGNTSIKNKSIKP